MKIRYFIYSLLALVALADACQNPLDGVKIGLKDPLQEGVIQYHFYDPAGNPLPKEYQIRIAGPNASQVVTTVNTTHFKLNTDGNLLLAPSPTAVYSSQTPFRYTLALEAENYLPLVQPTVLASTNRQSRTLGWINMLKPPVTMAAAVNKGLASSDGTVATSFATITTQSANGADQATVTLPQGLRLTDRDGQSVGSNLTLSVIHTNARTDQSTTYIPGNGVLSNVNGRNGGASLGTVRLIAIGGSVTMQVHNENYALASTVSKLIPWRMDLNPAMSNLANGKAIQEGDSIPLFSYDAFTNRWQEEEPGVVRRNAQTNRFEYQANARMMATYVVGWVKSICEVGPIFKVSSQLAGVDINYLCRLIDVTTGQEVAHFYANVNNGALISIYNQSRNRTYRLQIYDETDAWGKGAKGGLMGESGPAATCDRNPVVVNIPALPVPPQMSMEFKYGCPSGTTLDEASLPSLVIVQYSEVGRGNWRDLITTTRTQRKVASYKLQVGRRYDFRASTDGGATWPLHEDNYLVDKNDSSLEINADMYCK
jgi:hypothetical protein